MLRLWKKDVLVVAIAGGSVGLVAAVAEPVAGRFSWMLAAGVATALVVLVVLDAYRRLQLQLKEAAREQQESLKATYQRIQALLSLIATLQPTFPLPNTTTWSAFPDLLNLLSRLVLTRQPAQVFEIGSGMSTLTIAYCLRRVGKGTIISLESDPKFAAETRQMLADHGLSDIATVIDAPLTQVEIGGERWRWYDADRIPSTLPIDLLFIDGPHGLTQPLARYPALPLLFPRLAADSMIVLDDGARPDEKTIADRWTREFGISSEYLFLEKGAFVMTPRPSNRDTTGRSTS